jgi:hypothetical protein
MFAELNMPTESQAYKVVKEPYKLGGKIDAQIARSKENAERKKAPAVRITMTPETKAHLRGISTGTVQRSSTTSRARLQGKFLSALAEDFEQHGKRAIERMRIHDPSGYIKTVAFLMPKQFEQTTPIQDLTDEELERGIEFLKSKLAISDGKGIRAPTLIEQDSGIQTLPETD